MRTAQVLLLLLVLTLSLPHVALAQITNVTNSTSTPTPGLGHDYVKLLSETVNPANGSVSIRVATPAPPGRQLTIPFSFAYDSNGALVLRSSLAGGSAGFASNTTFLSEGGWSYGVPLLSADYILKTEHTPNGRPIQCEIDKDFLFQDPSGGRHALRLAGTQYRVISYCIEGPYLTGGDDYQYDTENHLTMVIPANGTFGDCSTAVACYFYNAEGQRIAKYTKGGTLTTFYIYGTDGEIVADADQTLAWNNTYIHFGGQLVAQYRGSNTGFLIKDHLGSTRLDTITPYSGSQSVYDNMDYLPFGEEIAGSSATTHKFTSKERDDETDAIVNGQLIPGIGLDNFGARYYSSSFARFMSPDPENSSGYDNPGDPQGWNAYSYVRNNPVNLTDPDGRDYRVCVDNGNGGQNCTTYDNFRDFQKALNGTGATLSGDDKSGQILINGQSVGSYNFFVGPGVEGGGVPDITADYFFRFPALFSGVRGAFGLVKGIFNLGRAAGNFYLITIGSGSRLAAAAAAREALMASGNVIDRIVETAAGEVRIRMVIVAEGETAVIKGIDIAGPGKMEVGYTEMSEGFKGALSELKDAGFKDFRIEPQYRTGGMAAGKWTGVFKGKL